VKDGEGRRGGKGVKDLFPRASDHRSGLKMGAPGRKALPKTPPPGRFLRKKRGGNLDPSFPRGRKPSQTGDLYLPENYKIWSSSSNQQGQTGTIKTRRLATLGACGVRPYGRTQKRKTLKSKFMAHFEASEP